MLAPDVTLAEAEVPDGAVLRVVAEHDVPPAPVVHDLIEEVSDGTDARAWRWGPVARRWTATAGVVAGCLLLAWMLARAASWKATEFVGWATHARLIAAGAVVAG